MTRPKRNLGLKRVPFFGLKDFDKGTGTPKKGIRAYSGSWMSYKIHLLEVSISIQ